MRAVLIAILVVAVAMFLGSRYKASLERDRLVREARTEISGDQISQAEYERRQAMQKQRADSMRAAYEKQMSSYKARPSQDSMLKQAARERRARRDSGR
jgi:Tfp pilus assembly protein PilV